MGRGDRRSDACAARSQDSGSNGMSSMSGASNMSRKCGVAGRSAVSTRHTLCESISNSAGVAPRTPRERPQSILHTVPLHAQFGPCDWTVWPTTTLLTGRPTSCCTYPSAVASMADSAAAFSSARLSRPTSRFQTRLSGPCIASESARRYSARAGSSAPVPAPPPPSIHVRTASLSFPSPNRRASSEGPPCTKRVSLTTRATLHSASARAIGPPGEKSAARALQSVSALAAAASPSPIGPSRRRIPAPPLRTTTSGIASAAPSPNSSKRAAWNRALSRRAPSVTYRKSPCTFITSWFPTRTCTSPPACRASSRNRANNAISAISSLPRSNKSPSCTRCVSPPHHRSVSGSSTPAVMSAFCV
mmetsp:Transcript_22948/g.74760  ORF Transcript_22948/g.74760 Transcript_22948/m.74760 type:complete len:361 (-) Transcript_22948:182-1264(-)